MKPYTLLNGALSLCGTSSGEDVLWLAASLPLLPCGQHFAEIGCGNGAGSLWLLHNAAAATRTLRATMVDNTFNNVQTAYHNAQKNNFSAEGVQANALHLPFPARSFALTFANPPYHLHQRGHRSTKRAQAHTINVETLIHWLTEMRRVTAPDGCTAVVLSADAWQGVAAQVESPCAVLWLQTAAGKAAKRVIAHWGQSPLSGTQTWQVFAQAQRTHVLHAGQSYHTHPQPALHKKNE